MGSRSQHDPCHEICPGRPLSPILGIWRFLTRLIGLGEGQKRRVTTKNTKDTKEVQRKRTEGKERKPVSLAKTVACVTFNSKGGTAASIGRNRLFDDYS
jgi:hypothetical protein